MYMVVFKGNPIDLVPWSLAIFFIPFITFYQIFIAMKITLNGHKNEEKIRFGIWHDKHLVWHGESLELKILGHSVVASKVQKMIIELKLVHSYFWKLFKTNMITIWSLKMGRCNAFFPNILLLDMLIFFFLFSLLSCLQSSKKFCRFAIDTPIAMKMVKMAKIKINMWISVLLPTCVQWWVCLPYRSQKPIGIIKSINYVNPQIKMD